MNTTDLGVLLVLLQMLIASPSLVELVRGLFGRRQSQADADRSDASASESAAESVRLLLDPLNARISALETQNKAFINREKQLQTEREEREATHKNEMDGLRTVLSSVQSELNEFRGGVDVLLAQMEGAGIIPRWRPKPKTGPLGQKGN